MLVTFTLALVGIEKAKEDCRHAFEVLHKVPLLRFALEPSSETGAE